MRSGAYCWVVELLESPTDAGRVVRFVGDADAATVGQLIESVRSLPIGDRHLDATSISFAGAAALGALVLLDQECAALGGRFTVSPSSALRRVASLARLDESLSFV